MTSNPLSVTGVSNAITALRHQTDDAGRPIDVQPQFLIVPPSLEFAARQLLASAEVCCSGTGTDPTGNPVQGMLQLVVEPRLGVDTPVDSWYVSADARSCPMIVGMGPQDTPASRISGNWRGRFQCSGRFVAGLSRLRFCRWRTPGNRQEYDVTYRIMLGSAAYLPCLVGGRIFYPRSCRPFFLVEIPERKLDMNERLKNGKADPKEIIPEGSKGKARAREWAIQTLRTAAFDAGIRYAIELRAVMEERARLDLAEARLQRYALDHAEDLQDMRETLLEILGEDGSIGN